MLHLAPNDKVKLDINPLRTFWFPSKGGIPEKNWNVVGLAVSYKAA